MGNHTHRFGQAICWDPASIPLLANAGSWNAIVPYNWMVWFRWFLLFCGLFLAGEVVAAGTGFVPNHGQLRYSTGEQANAIRCYAALDGYQVYFADDRIIYVYHNGTADRVTHRIDFVLEGAVAGISPEVRYALPQRTRYYLPGRAYNHSVGHYQEIWYTGIYPNTDLRYYFEGGQLKYDFVVHPGGTPGAPAFRIEGADSVRTREGRVWVYCGDAVLVNEAPLSYQGAANERDTIQSAYLNEQFHLRFQTGIYDSCRKLVIDPVQSWSTYLGGSADDEVRGIAASRSNVYVAGITSSNNLPGTSGAFQQSLEGGQDAYIARFDTSGTHQWTTYLGGSNDDVVKGIDIIGTDLYAAGTTQSTDFPVSTGAFQSGFGGVRDAFVVKFTTAGNLVWCTYYGGNNTDEGNGVACGNGKVALIGTTQSTDLSVPGAFQPSFDNGTDAYLVQFDSNGTVDWGTYIGGNNNDQGLATCIAADGSVYFCGSSGSPDFPVQNAYQASHDNGQDAVAGRFSDSGSRLWITYYGGDQYEEATSISANNASQVFFAGSTISTDFPVSPGAYQSSNAGGRDVFVVCMDDTGNREWATYYGGSIDDYGLAITASPVCDSVYFGGYTQSSDLPVTLGTAYQATFQGASTDAFFSGMSTNGTFHYGSYYGGSNDEYALCIDIDENHKLYIGGYTNSTDFPTANAYQSSHSNAYDGFIASFQAQSCPMLLPIAGEDQLTCVNSASRLEWSAGFGQQVSLYQVLRSTDGIRYQVIGEVPVANPRDEDYYGFEDRAPPPGTVYYKIRRIAYNGQISDGSILTADCGPANSLSIAPNPIEKNQLQLYWTGSKGHSIQLSVFDVNGREVHTARLQVGDSHVYVLYLPQLEAGIYYVQVISESHSPAVIFVVP